MTAKAAWPPPCEAPGCTEPGEPHPGGVTVDFGTLGAHTLIRLCDDHARRWAPNRERAKETV